MTSTYFWLGASASSLCASADADRAGGPTDLSRCASQPKALIPCAFDEDGLTLLMLAELHANVPEADRPMSMSDLSDDQAQRARNAVRKIIVASLLSAPAGRFASIAELERAIASGEHA